MNSSKRKQGPRVYGNRQQKRRPSQWAPFLDEDNDMVHRSSTYNPPNPAPPLPKSRPLSQKEAMASAPNAEDVRSVVEVTSVPPELAARYLRVKQENVEAAILAILDNEDIGALEKNIFWDESLFTTDREGNEAALHPLGTSPAPTRGPSPAPSLGMSQPTNRSQEDKDLEAAIALSRQDQDMPFQQESGIRLQDGTETAPKFGPATREHYERDQWALVPASTATQEVVPDIDVEHRRNGEHEPRFLKHLPDGDYTPNFITICQAIPAAREAFLLRDHVRFDYGQDSEWWRGHPIPMPRIVHTTDSSPTQPDSDAQEELIYETQRLMAFLDGGARSYATIGALTQTDSIKAGDAASSQSGSLLELFIKNWITAAHGRSAHPDDVARLFTTRVGTSAVEGTETTELSVVELNVNSKDGEKVDLSELLDDLLWNTDPYDQGHSPPDNFIKRPAEIIVIKLSLVNQAATQLGVEIPAAIQLDKYLEKNVITTRDIRQEMVQGRRRIQSLEEIERKLKAWQHPRKSANIVARELLQYTLDHYSGQTRRDLDRADSSGSAAPASTQPQHYPETAKKLEEVIARVDQQLELLEREKERARKTIADISKSTFSGSSGEPEHRYTLRGVATKPNITYVLRPKDEHDKDDMLLQPDEDSSTPPDMQWWRLDYEVTDSTAKITKSKTDDYDVLRAVELEHNAALLVYASADACSSDLYEPLPSSLQAFVRRDNDLFLADLRAAQRRAPAPPPPPAYEDYQDEPRESIERSSMDSTRVEPGTDSPRASAPSPPGYKDEAFGSNPRFGPGYDLKQVEHVESLDPPVAEIKLSPRREEEEAADLLCGMKENEKEMVQKSNPPLFPRDTRMGGTESQDAGVGGAVQGEEDVEMR